MLTANIAPVYEAIAFPDSAIALPSRTHSTRAREDAFRCQTCIALQRVLAGYHVPRVWHFGNHVAPTWRVYSNWFR